MVPSFVDDSGSSSNVWFWVLTSIAFISSILGLMGDVLLHRNNKMCFYFYFGFILIYIVNVAVNNLWYETVTQCLMLGIVFSAYMNWGLPGKEKDIITIKYINLALILTSIIAITCLLGVLMMVFVTNDYKDPYPYLDAFISVTFFGGWIMMTRKIFQAYIIYVLCTIATLVLCILMITSGSYYYLIYTGTNIFYLIFYAIGSSNWYKIIKEQRIKLIL